VFYRILHRVCFLVAIPVVSSLVVGCNSVSSSVNSTSTKPSPQPKRQGGLRAEPAIDALAEAHAHYAAGVIHEMNEDGEAALQEYHQAALGDPDNEALIMEVSRRFLQKKQPEKALELLSRASGRPNASGAILARLGLIYLQLGKHEQAVTANRAAIKKSPELLTGYQNLFLNYLQTKQSQQALNALDEAARLPNTEAEFLISLAELYANFGLQVPSEKESANAKALAVLNRAEKLEPTSAPLQLRLADGFNLAGASDKAAKLYLELLKKLPNLPLLRERVRAKLTEIYMRGSDRKRAVEQLESIIRDDPTNAQAYYSLASIAYEEKKFAEAADYLSKTILLSPDFEQPYYDLASSQLALNKPGEALGTLEKARKKFSQNFVMELLMGMAFSRQKAYTEAIQHYTAAEVIAQATEPARLNHGFYFQLGAAFERKSDYVQAEKYFEKCLQLAPDFAEALNYLGYMWAERGTNLAKARELIEKALKIEP
jgi:tetratricopeptide (TPR) repeat protein